MTKIDNSLTMLPYCTSPMTLPIKKWGILCLSVLLAVAILMGTNLAIKLPLIDKIAIAIFTALPICTLMWLTPDSAKSLFKKINRRAIAQMFGYGLLVFFISILSSYLMIQILDTVPNQAVNQLAELATLDKVLFYLFSIPQLFGEEVITIIPLIALFYVLHQHFKWSKPTSLFIAWVISSVWFALFHLPTYQWHLMQVLFGVGFARLMLTFIYLRTKNLWVSTGAHIINDWLMFSLTILLTAK